MHVQLSYLRRRGAVQVARDVFRVIVASSIRYAPLETVSAAVERAVSRCVSRASVARTAPIDPAAWRRRVRTAGPADARQGSLALRVRLEAAIGAAAHIVKAPRRILRLRTDAAERQHGKRCGGESDPSHGEPRGTSEPSGHSNSTNPSTAAVTFVT